MSDEQQLKDFPQQDQRHYLWKWFLCIAYLHNNFLAQGNIFTTVAFESIPHSNKKCQFPVKKKPETGM
eukprot:c19633_g3_i1 orf=283-486(-)